MNSKDTILCPSCGEKFGPNVEKKLFPFCSKRCQLVDLGKWFGEEYAIPTKEISEEEDNLALADIDDTTMDD